MAHSSNKFQDIERNRYVFNSPKNPTQFFNLSSIKGSNERFLFQQGFKVIMFSNKGFLSQCLSSFGGKLTAMKRPLPLPSDDAGCGVMMTVQKARPLQVPIQGILAALKLINPKKQWSSCYKLQLNSLASWVLWLNKTKGIRIQRWWWIRSLWTEIYFSGKSATWKLGVLPSTGWKWRYFCFC